MRPHRFSPPCPRCYSETKVVATFEAENTYDIIRRRCCYRCGHRFYTGQYSEEVLPDKLELKFPPKNGRDGHGIYQVRVMAKTHEGS